MVEISAEQRKKMMEVIAGPLGANAPVIGPIFLQIIEKMSEKEVNALVESAADLMMTANETVEKIKKEKNVNPWFQ